MLIPAGSALRFHDRIRRAYYFDKLADAHETLREMHLGVGRLLRAVKGPAAAIKGGDGAGGGGAGGGAGAAPWAPPEMLGQRQAPRVTVAGGMFGDALAKAAEASHQRHVAAEAERRREAAAADSEAHACRYSHDTRHDGSKLLDLPVQILQNTLFSDRTRRECTATATARVLCAEATCRSWGG